MKEFKLLIWLTQLGLSIAVPLAGFVFLAVWLHRSQGWGVWVIPVGVVIGLACTFSSFRSSLQAMSVMSRSSRRQDPPPVSFNEHK